MNKCPKCTAWKRNFPKVLKGQHLSMQRADSEKERNQLMGTPFSFCPWCGTKLVDVKKPV